MATGKASIPIHRRCNWAAAMSVVPDPQKPYMLNEPLVEDVNTYTQVENPDDSL